MSLTGCLGDGVGDTLATLTGPTTTLATSFTTMDETSDTAGDGDPGDGDPGDGDGDPGDGDGDGDPGDGDGDPGDGDGDPGDGDGDPTTGDGDGDPGSIGESCTNYSYQIGDCYGAEYIGTAYDYCMMYYQEWSSMYGVDCGIAFEAFIVCLSNITCEEFAMDPPAGCDQAIADVQGACQ